MVSEDFKTRILPCYRRMFAVAVTMLRDRDEAADAVQDAMTRLWEKKAELVDISVPEAFCVTMVKRICIDRLRAGQAHPPDGLESVRTLSAEDADAGAREKSMQDLISRMILLLPPSQQRVIRLSIFNECSNDEIAGITGESPSNVRQLLSRARRKIKELYLKYNNERF